MRLLQINEEMQFFRFLSAAAKQTGHLINYAELAKAAEISAPTSKQWIKTLEAAGIIYLLQPFMPDGSKYIVKTPKLYFFDTGLAAYLSRYLSAESLEIGQQSSEFFETWVIMEIYKNYINNGMIPPLYYMRNFNSKELELIIFINKIAYPLAIKKNTYKMKTQKTFAIFDPVCKDAKIQFGTCGIICSIDNLSTVSENMNYIPAWLI